MKCSFTDHVFQTQDMTFDVPVVPRFKWPKRLPPISSEQQAIADDFMAYWLSILPNKFGLVERFNHKYPLRSLTRMPSDHKIKTLEIGAGIGAHIASEPLNRQEYYCVELREPMAERIRQRHPSVITIAADCQISLPYDDGYFDRAIAIHVLEHLPDLPAALDQIARVLRPGGLFSVVYPCDPGLAYEVARKISAERLFKKRYKLPYKWLIRREHINSPCEIEFLIGERFRVIDRKYFPLAIPLVNLNLCVGITAAKPQ